MPESFQSLDNPQPLDPLLAPLMNIMPAVEAWLEQEAVWNASSEPVHQPEPYAPSAKAEQLEELLNQAASSRSISIRQCLHVKKDHNPCAKMTSLHGLIRIQVQM